MMIEWDKLVEEAQTAVRHAFEAADDMADRIEELESRNKELTLQLLAVHGQAADALDKLTKAVDTLQKISAKVKASKLPIAGLILHECTKALTELEGQENE